MEYPALRASCRNILTVSSEYSSSSLPTSANFASTSFVAVMMWQPTASAWKTFSSSRGLAQISSAWGRACNSSTARFISGTGSRPVSAIRPAKTETNAPTSSARLSTTRATCSSVRIAVTFSFTPAAESRRTRESLGSPRVFVTGTFTKTFSPHEAISIACRSISSKSSEKTSNEMGRSPTIASTSRAKPA